MDTNKSGSKPNLNESHIPLLEEEGKIDHPEKEEKIEMESKVDGDKDEKSTDEKKDEDGKKDKKKAKKEKIPKEKKEGPKKTPLTCAQNCTIGLNVLDRDEKHINDHVNIYFEDVIAEADSLHGFEFIWRVTYLIFTSSRSWFYGLITAVLAPFLAIFWALIFAIFSAAMVWILMPLFKLFEITIHYAHKYWNAVVRCLLDPVFAAAGLLFGNIRTRSEQHVHSHNV